MKRLKMNRLASFASALFVSFFFFDTNYLQNCSVRAFVLSSLAHPAVRKSNQCPSPTTSTTTLGSIHSTSASFTTLQASPNPYERYSQMQDVFWEYHTQLLEEYQSRFGNCDVPFNYYVRAHVTTRRYGKASAGSYDDAHEEDAELVNLGKWLRRQREAKRSNQLPEYKCIRLEEMGVDWDTNSGLKDAYTVTVSRHLKDAAMDYIKWRRSFSFDGQVADRSLATWMSEGSGNLERRVLNLKPTTESVHARVARTNADAISGRSRWDVTREGWISHAEYTPFPWYS